MKNDSNIQSAIGDTMAKVNESQELLDRDIPSLSGTKKKVSNLHLRVLKFRNTIFPISLGYNKSLNEIISLYRKGFEDRKAIQFKLRKQIIVKFTKFCFKKIVQFTKKYHKNILLILFLLITAYSIYYFDVIEIVKRHFFLLLAHDILEIILERIGFSDRQ